MARVYYVDVAIPADRKKRGKHKMHAVFDGSRVFRVKKLTELEDAAEVYIDAMFPQIYEELMELIEMNAKIFLLRNISLLKRLRKESKVEKSDEADAKLLSKIPRRCFRELTLKEIKLLRLINEYEIYSEWKRIVKQWMSLHALNSFKECMRELQSLQRHYARRIINEIKDDERYAMIYRLACDMIGVRNSAEIAILIIRLPLNWKLSRLRGLLGLTPYRNKKYNHKLRLILSRAAVAIYLNKKRFKRKPRILEEIPAKLPYKKIARMLEIRILKALKKAWQQSRCVLAGGQ